jgi:thiosulfate reductase/polysulfide reductase chain A
MFHAMEFVAVIDIQPTDSAWLADVILPESTYLERTDPVEEFPTPYPFAGLRTQVVPPLFDTRPNLEIMQGIARRLGVPEYLDFTIDQLIAAQLTPLGVGRAEFDRTGVYAAHATRPIGTTLTPEYRFRTPSGKIELANERFRRQGLAPLPVYARPVGPATGEFRLLPGKQAFFTHAANQNNEWLLELCGENRLWIHTREAAARGIASGDLVVVRSPIGAVTVRALVTERIRPDCVHLPHGFGHTSPAMRSARGRGASDQDLIVPRWDRISGNAALHETFVTVEKADQVSP